MITVALPPFTAVLIKLADGEEVTVTVAVVDSVDCAELDDVGMAVVEEASEVALDDEFAVAKELCDLVEDDGTASEEGNSVLWEVVILIEGVVSTNRLVDVNTDRLAVVSSVGVVVWLMLVIILAVGPFDCIIDIDAGAPTFGQSALTPSPVKNIPMRVVGSAFVPSQAEMMTLVMVSRHRTHRVEHGWRDVKSDAVQPLMGVL